MLAGLAKWVPLAVGGLLALGIVLIVWGIAEYASPFPVVEITHQKPYAAFVGREYRVVTFANLELHEASIEKPEH